MSFKFDLDIQETLFKFQFVVEKLEKRSACRYTVYHSKQQINDLLNVIDLILFVS